MENHNTGFLVSAKKKWNSFKKKMKKEVLSYYILNDFSKITCNDCIKYDTLNEEIYRKLLNKKTKTQEEYRNCSASFDLEIPVIPRPNNYERFIIWRNRNSYKKVIDQSKAIIYLTEKKLVLDVHYEAYQAIELAYAIKKYEGGNFNIQDETMDFSNIDTDNDKNLLRICNKYGYKEFDRILKRHNFIKAKRKNKYRRISSSSDETVDVNHDIKYKNYRNNINDLNDNDLNGLDIHMINDTNNTDMNNYKNINYINNDRNRIKPLLDEEKRRYSGNLDEYYKTYKNYRYFVRNNQEKEYSNSENNNINNVVNDNHNKSNVINEQSETYIDPTDKYRERLQRLKDSMVSNSNLNKVTPSAPILPSQNEIEEVENETKECENNISYNPTEYNQNGILKRIDDDYVKTDNPPDYNRIQNYRYNSDYQDSVSLYPKIDNENIY